MLLTTGNVLFRTRSFAFVLDANGAALSWWIGSHCVWYSKVVAVLVK